MGAWVYVLPTVGTGGPGCVPCSGLLPTPCPLHLPFKCNWPSIHRDNVL